MKKSLLLYLIESVMSLSIILSGASCHQVALEDLSSMDTQYQYINLKTADERRQGMENQLKIASIKYQRIEAVYGKDLSAKDLDDMVNSGLYDRTVKEKSPLKPGEVGVYLSNINKAIPNAIKNSNSITVTFEDDVIIPSDVDIQFKQALKAVPADWDILYLGCYQNYYVTLDGKIIGPYLPTSIDDAKAYKYPLCATGETHRVEGTPWIQLDGSCVAGLYAYALRKKSAEKIAGMLRPIRQAIDRQLTEYVGVGKLQAYCLSPELIRVNTTIPSTIR